MAEWDLYALADATNQSVEVEGKTLTSAKPRVFDYGGLCIDAPCRVVSSYIGNLVTFALTEVSGDVGHLLVVTHRAVTLLLIDLSKLKNRGSKLLERAKPKSFEDALALLRDATVLAAQRNKNEPWIKLQL